MELIPAIDLMGGQVVRLQQGDASRKTVYGVEPAEMARRFEDAGVTRIHVVDLDGAFGGVPLNLPAIREIRGATRAVIEVGGGIRDADHVRVLFAEGIDCAIIGTKALEDPAFLREMVAEFGPRIIVGADARDGRLATRGWTTDTQVMARDYIAALRRDPGIRTVIYTDIARDGMFSSPNIAALEEILSIEGLDVIASGGVGSLADLHLLRSLNRPNLRGVIVGKALYDGRLNLAEALAACSGTH
ncbi:MAG: 1-(5-phosphoribosyl)-5-[(5-phosphoribosylamino)methylideneamino]imidazole-4-carboxamide isomerase [Candidatus Sumerlaeaceae bacterium]|nr:1-(5-phosphoribosyl)-5-[(5-phosphoribosylamino)methylideneamino]imidazole-4-carboxamide isomerase [Candidatus Sumerlaeaceae bacterium]